MFKYCPSCASEKILFIDNKVWKCPDCGLTYYHNTAAATSCIINTDAGIIFLVRNKEPGKGLLDLPGGFIDPGEGALEGLSRELTEELGCEGFLKDIKITFFGSFPNKYQYKNFLYNTCDLFFFLDAPGLSEKDLCIEKTEISGVQFIKPSGIDMEKIAFESVKKGLRLYLDIHADPD